MLQAMVKEMFMQVIPEIEFAKDRTKCHKSCLCNVPYIVLVPLFG